MSPNVGVLAGVDEIIDRHLGIAAHRAQPPQYAHVSTARALSGAPPLAFRSEPLAEDILDQVGRNWRSAMRAPSSKNWRFTKERSIAPHNTSPEKTLEKAIVRVTGDEWANQIPTASGLVNATSDRHRNIDLAFRSGADGFELIELKIASDTPLFAAIELFQYGVLYLFWRLNFPTHDAAHGLLLEAKSVHLRVLAPLRYYHNYSFGWLELELTRGLRRVIENRGLSFTLDFNFTVFPSDFEWPCSDVALRAALLRRGPVAWPA